MNKLYIGITAILLCLVPVTGFTQSIFQKQFTKLTEYQQLTSSPGDNSYVLAAAVGTDEGLDFSALKISASGKILWSKMYSSPGDDYLTAVAVSPAGDIFMGGHTLNKEGHFDLSLMKLDASGNLKWYKTVETAVSDLCVSISTTAAGDIFLTGNIDSDTKKHIWILKMNASGEVLWSRIYGSSKGGNKNMNILSSTVTKEGGLAVTGIDDQHNYFLKLNPDGTESITKIGNTISYLEETSSLKQLKDGSYLFCGKVKDCDDVLCTYIFSFMKLDETGNVVWSKNVVRSESTSIKYIGKGRDAIQTADGGYAFIGQLTDPEKSKLVVIKTASDGSVQWTRGYGDADSYGEYAGIEPAVDGGLLFLGTEHSKAVLIKTNADGVAACNSQPLNPVFLDDAIPKLVNATFTVLKDAYTTIILSCTERPLAVTDTVICDKLTGIGNTPSGEAFRIYPNPFTDKLTLEVNQLPKGEWECNIFNMLGEKIISQAFSNEQFTISFNSIPSGIYLYEIRTNGVVIASGKLIAQ